MGLISFLPPSDFVLNNNDAELDNKLKRLMLDVDRSCSVSQKAWKCHSISSRCTLREDSLVDTIIEVMRKLYFAKNYIDVSSYQKPINEIALKIVETCLVEKKLSKALDIIRALKQSVGRGGMENFLSLAVTQNCDSLSRLYEYFLNIDEPIPEQFIPQIDFVLNHPNEIYERVELKINILELVNPRRFAYYLAKFFSDEPLIEVEQMMRIILLANKMLTAEKLKTYISSLNGANIEVVVQACLYIDGYYDIARYSLQFLNDIDKKKYAPLLENKKSNKIL